MAELVIRRGLEEPDTSDNFVPHKPVRPEKSEGGRPFKVVSDYQPAGDQPTAIAQLVEGVNDGLTYQTLLGGVLGIGLSLAVGWGFETSGSSFTLVYSTLSMVAAFVCSTLIGVIFGFLPANNAAKLNPIDALARE